MSAYIKNVAWVLGLLFGAWGVASCSLMLDFNPTNQPCDGSLCLPGYSCLFGQCKPNHTISKGQSCNRLGTPVEGSGCVWPEQSHDVTFTDLLCEVGPDSAHPLACNPCDHICATTCDEANFFVAETRCEVGTFCRPIVAATPTTDKPFAGICTNSRACNGANPANPCASDEVCVLVLSSNNVYTCMKRCDVTFKPHGGSVIDYTDSCSDVGYEGVCHLVGPLNVPVCTPSSATPATEGQSCHAYNKPCGGDLNAGVNEGFICLREKCTKVCNLSSSADWSIQCNTGTSGQHCCDIGVQPGVSGAEVFGVCLLPSQASSFGATCQ